VRCPDDPGLRIPVATVVSTVVDDMTIEEIIDDLPGLSPENVAEALRYAAETVRERQLPLRVPYRSAGDAHMSSSRRERLARFLSLSTEHRRPLDDGSAALCPIVLA